MPLSTIILIRIATGTIIPQILRIRRLDNSSKFSSRIAKSRGRAARDQTGMRRIRWLLSSIKCNTTRHITSNLQCYRRPFIISQSLSQHLLWIRTLSKTLLSRNKTCRYLRLAWRALLLQVLIRSSIKRARVWLRRTPKEVSDRVRASWLTWASLVKFQTRRPMVRAEK